MTPHHNNYDLIREGQAKRNKRKRNKNLAMILAGAALAFGSVGIGLIVDDDKDMYKSKINYSASILESLDKNQNGILSKSEVKNFYNFFDLNSKAIPFESITSSQWNYFLDNYR
jgi:hypothetical protein